MKNPHTISDNLSLVGIERCLTPGHGFALTLAETVTSTNTLLQEAAQTGAPEGTVLIAAGQTVGRGQMGRDFFSPANTGLYLSLLLRPNCSADKALRLTPAAAVAVCTAIEQTLALPVGIKWVNDIMLSGRKAGGILTEAGSHGTGRLDYAIIGIGLNVYQPVGGFPPLLRETAVCLCDKPLPELRNRLAAAILTELAARYHALDDPTLINTYRAHCLTPGQRLTVLRNGVAEPALALSVDDNFRLRVRYDDGTESSVSTATSVTLEPAL